MARGAAGAVPSRTERRSTPHGDLRRGALFVLWRWQGGRCSPYSVPASLPRPALLEVAVSFSASLGRASVLLLAVWAGGIDQIQNNDNLRPAGTLRSGV